MNHFHPPSQWHPEGDSYGNPSSAYSTSSSSYSSSYSSFTPQPPQQQLQQQQFPGGSSRYPSYQKKHQHPLDKDELQERQQRRIYVGNLPASATQEQLAMLINHAMIHAKLWDGADTPPVLRCNVRPNAQFAFLIFSTAEHATASLAFDGILLAGNKLKLKRPTEYVAPSGARGSTSPDSPYKLFIGGLPSSMCEQDVLSILTPFGPLRAFNLVRDAATQLSKGFAFCEYEDPSVNDLVCRSLHGHKFSGKTLVVQLASLGSAQVGLSAMGDQGALQTSPSDDNGHSNDSETNDGDTYNNNIHDGTAHPNSANNESEIDITTINVVKTVLNLACPVPEVVSLLRSIEKEQAPSRVLMLLNVSSIEKLREDDFYHDLVIDLHETCSLYGKVLSLTVPRLLHQTTSRSRLTPGSIGKAYIQFETLEESQLALQHLGGSIYDQDRHLIAMYYPEKLYSQI